MPLSGGDRGTRMIERKTIPEYGPDTWRAADPSILDATDLLSASLRGFRHEVRAEDTCEVDTVSVLGCDLYSVLQTDEHDDAGFLPWTALLVLRTNGHSLTVHDGETVLHPEVGDVVLFDLERTHCLDLPDRAFPPNEDRWFDADHLDVLCREFPFVCAHVDLDHRPTREEAEKLIAEALLPAFRERPRPSFG